MNDDESSKLIQIDLRTSQIEALDEQLRIAQSQGDTIELTGTEDIDFVGLRSMFTGHVLIKGSMGHHCWVANSVTDVEIQGNVESACGQACEGGSIFIRGQAGATLAAYSRAGLLVAYANAGPRCAAGLSGADVIVRGKAGFQAGYRMQSGTLVIGGGAGPALGEGMTGGTIFLRSDAESISSHLIESKMREPDRLRLALLMLKAGIKSSGQDFRMFRAHA